MVLYCPLHGGVGMMKNRLQWRGMMRRGAVMVETALGFGFMIFMVFAILQFALILNGIITVQHYTTEAARYAAVHYEDAGFSTTTVDDYVENSLAPNGTVAYSGLTIAYTPPTTPTTTETVSGITESQYAISVTITYNLADKYIISEWLPGFKASWPYTYNYTIFAEGM